jgi:uncharacterized protein YjgD (DUF1641 family)
MDEAQILQKLDALSNEIQSLKSGVVAELRKDMLPIAQQTGPLVSDCLSDLDQEHRREDLVHFMRNMVLNVETLNSLLSTVKGAMELKNEMEPIAKQVLPRITDLFAEMDGQYDLDEIAALLRNTLSNVQHFNTAITMLKSGMELKDEIEPMAKLLLPRITELFAEMDGQYDVEEIATLMRNTLGNIHHFNTAISLLKSGMELKEEIEPIAKLTLPKVIDFIGEMGGMLTVAGAALESLKGCKFSPEQAEAMGNVIRSIDLSKPNRIGPVRALKKLYDPKIQEALGVVFTILEAVGSMIQAHRENK